MHYLINLPPRKEPPEAIEYELGGTHRFPKALKKKKKF
jgi:hypothetical protein